MTEPLTTEGLDVPDALELIARWLREGREIESCYNNSESWHRVNGWLSENVVYRSKPAKPRLGKLRYESDSGYVTECKDPRKDLVCVDAIELTPEVCAILEREGLL